MSALLGATFPLNSLEVRQITNIVLMPRLSDEVFSNMVRYSATKVDAREI